MPGRSLGIMVVGLGVILTMVLFPPWVYPKWVPGRSQTGPPGMYIIPEVQRDVTVYAPIFRPPQRWRVRLNVERLLVQCGIAAGVTAILALRSARGGRDCT